MNFLDIILICIVGIFLIRGFFRGLVQEILSLTAIVLAIFLASNYQHLIVPHLELYIKSEITVSALAYVLIFFGTLVVFWLIAKAIRTMLDISLLGWIDRAAGGIFGLLEGVLIGLIILMFLHAFAPKSEWLSESYIAPRSQHMLQLVGDLAPNSVRNALESRGFSFPSAQEAIDSAKEVIGLDDEQPQE